MVVRCGSLRPYLNITAKRYLNQIATLQPKPEAASKSAATFKDQLENVSIRTRRSPSTKTPEYFNHAARILASDALKDRAFLYTIIPGSNVAPTHAGFHNVKDKDCNLGRPRHRMKFHLGKNRRNADIVLRAASTLARFLERWAPAINTGPKEREILAAVALELTSARPCDDYPVIEFEIPKSYYSCKVDGIDLDSGKCYSIYVEVRPENITSFEVPQIPGNKKFDLRGMHRSIIKVVNKSTRLLPATSEIPVKDRKHEAAIKVLRLVLWKYHNKIHRLSDLQYAIEELVLKYAAKTQGVRGPYDGDRLYHLGINDIRPSAAVIRDTDPKLPSIDLVEARESSAVLIIDAINSTWISSGDLKKSWLAGWETAQTVNEGANAAKEKRLMSIA